MNYDLIIIGSGPGGYVAGIRASQLGMKVAIIEKAEIGGICLNWGCIPTKALLKSASVYEYTKNAKSYGVDISGDFSANFENMIKRSREIAENMSKGIKFLFRKNKITVLKGFGKILSNKKVEVTDFDGLKKTYNAENIIIATGARSRQLPNLKQDGRKIIGYREALSLQKQPESILIVGSGAIGSEFAYFYNSIGTKVTLVEYMSNILPLEDIEVSKQVGRSFKKSKIKVLVKSNVESVDISGEMCKTSVRTKKGIEVFHSEIVLSAVGITPNIENIGIENLGIELENGKIKVDKYFQTNVKNIFAIGDVIDTAALAHLASAEGIFCVEKISGENPEFIDYNNIPACTYTSPEVASVGYTEKEAIKKGFDIKVGKFPFTASGKAIASGAREGFIKLIFNKKNDELIGGHFVGMNVTEMIAEIVLARKLNVKAKGILKAVHPHPTMSEAIMEAAAVALKEAIHI